MKVAHQPRRTILDCQVGNHIGHFEIIKTPMGWACPKCIGRLQIKTTKIDGE